MGVAEILCTCGHRFPVADDGNGTPHPCPKCKVQNVLPRQRRAGDRSITLQSPGETGVRTTAVLSPIAAAHQSVIQGLPAGTMVGPYRTVRRVGRGGMGSVYEAIDERSQQRVALKVLSAELSAQPDFVARFHRESRALSSFTDERIASVFFSGAAEGIPFFAMEFVDGKNLEEIMNERGPLRPDQAIAWMREIALGLEVAAEHGLIHRDVKPTNILIDLSGRVRIVDFGLAKALDSDTRLTVTGAVVGTPFYLSPEQGLSKPVDQRSDIYSLGATFYHLLTGSPPFEAENSVSIILKHVHDSPTPIKDRNSAVPEPLARIVMRCLSKEPRHRYQDYDELIRDLDAAKAGEPVAAPRESATIRRAPSYVVMDDLADGSYVLRYATRIRRALALAFDLVLVVGVAKWMPQTELLGAVALLFAIGYFALGDGMGGRTLGKQFFRLRVGKPDGGQPGFGRTFLRGILLVPLVLTPILYTKNFVVFAETSRLIEHYGLLPPAVLHRITESGLLDVATKAIYVFVAIDLGACIFTAKHATMHDLLSGTFVFSEQVVKRSKKKKREKQKLTRPLSPKVPLVLAIVPGLGQLANGEMGKALVFFIAMCVASWDPRGIIAVWILSAVEAYRTAKVRRAQWEQSQIRA